jgi:hypothetical protein
MPNHYTPAHYLLAREHRRLEDLLDHADIEGTHVESYLELARYNLNEALLEARADE